MENNVDYKLVLNLNEQRYYELKLAKSKALPTLNAFINYGTSAFSNTFSFFENEQQWYGSSVLGFDLKIPIFSSLNRSSTTQRAKIAYDQAKTQALNQARALAVEQAAGVSVNSVTVNTTVAYSATLWLRYS